MKPAPGRLRRRVQQVLAGQADADLHSCGWLLWRAGLPCRAVRLPPEWWLQPTDVEAGLWLVQERQENGHTWLAQQRGDHLELTPLDPAHRVPPPAPAELNLEVLSIWPALLPLPQPPRWQQLMHYLQLASATRRAVPAALLRAALWLLLPLLLLAVLQGQLPAAMAALWAALSLALALMLENQWWRLWRNRSDRQRAALGLNGLLQVLHLPLQLLHHYGGGGSMALARSLQQLGQRLPLLLADVLPALALLIGSSLLLLHWQPRLGLISGLAMLAWLLGAALMLPVASRRRHLLGQQRLLTQRRSHQLLEQASNLRLAGAEQRALAWWQEPDAASQSLQRQLDASEGWMGGIGLAAAATAVGAALWTVQQTPALSASLSLVGLQLAGTLQLVGQLQQLDQLLPHWIAARELLAAPSEWRPNALDPGTLRGELSVQDLQFRYSPDQPPVLDGITFSVPAGGFVALVGPSGGGKSTLLHLLLGFMEPQRGSIRFDGHEAHTLQHERLRGQIGTVLQSVQLSGGTLLEVIAAGRAVSVEQAWLAAEQAGLAEELRTLPMGLQTLIPAGGGTLSGGQRQRLAIARALAGQPRLLLLDEPTSALDNITQRTVLANLQELGITRLLVAHRLSTVRQADLILVLDGGRIVQRGTYADLQHQSGLFAELVARQRC